MGAGFTRRLLVLLDYDCIQSNPRPDFFSSSSFGSNNSNELGVSEGKRRRKSISHMSQDVVTIGGSFLLTLNPMLPLKLIANTTITPLFLPYNLLADQIRPDWEAKLNAVRAQVARRANRRIVMRQVGDQLIPVGITSGRVVALPPGSEGAVVIDENSLNSRRRRRPERGNGGGGNGPDINQLLGHMGMGMGGPDLEEVSWTGVLFLITIFPMCLPCATVKRMCVLTGMCEFFSTLVDDHGGDATVNGGGERTDTATSRTGTKCCQQQRQRQYQRWHWLACPSSDA